MGGIEADSNKPFALHPFAAEAFVAGENIKKDQVVLSTSVKRKKERIDSKRSKASDSLFIHSLQKQSSQVRTD